MYPLLIWQLFNHQRPDRLLSGWDEDWEGEGVPRGAADHDWLGPHGSRCRCEIILKQLKLSFHVLLSLESHVCTKPLFTDNLKFQHRQPQQPWSGFSSFSLSTLSSRSAATKRLFFSSSWKKALTVLIIHYCGTRAAMQKNPPPIFKAW